MRVAITGITGLLARNLLFEILKFYSNGGGDLEIIAFGRSTESFPLKKRISELLENDGIDYVSSDKKAFVSEMLNKSIIPVEFDLSKSNLGISDRGFGILKNKPIDFFFHLAAVSDFRTAVATKEKLTRLNIEGTNQVLELANHLKVGEFIFTGTAYSYGTEKGVIKPDSINLNDKFRNFYEESKLLSENRVRQFCKANHIKFRSHRPVGICGRLIEEKIGSICKYDTFYAWAQFLLKQKMKEIKHKRSIYSEQLNMPLRVLCEPESFLNSIPADYAAKLLWALSYYNDSGQSYHLANEHEIKNDTYLRIILQELGISGIEFINKTPTDMNRMEKLYYKSVGRIYTPYLLENNIEFYIDNLKSFGRKHKISCPPMNESNFRKLIGFAKENYFGLEIN
ncbi:MAG: SDR family oxidoreductase [Candidatus Margulisiibacteriota bacterium]